MQRYHTIESLLAPYTATEQITEAAIRYWEQMATQMISLIGEEGFNSLYTRSAFLTQRTYQWLPVGTSPVPPSQRFSELKTCFLGRSTAEVRGANKLLLITFTDILALLIGEELLNSILHSAWGTKPDNTDEEFVNE